METEINNSIQVNTEENSEDLLQLVSFNIENEEYCVDILYVQEIIRMVEVTRVPNAAEYVVGVINLRGKVLPIIDLRKRIGLSEKEYDKYTRIVVIEIGTKIIGFIVDKVNEVIRINKNITEAPPSMVETIDSEFITSIGKLDDRLLILLDLEKLFENTIDNSESDE